METVSLSTPSARAVLPSGFRWVRLGAPVQPNKTPLLGLSDDPALDSEGIGEVRRRTGYEEFGGQIAGVLAAAEQAAEQIRAEAELEAERVRAEADSYANDVRHAVDSYAQQQRREAEGDARDTLASAQAEARAMREAAQAMAGQLEAEARRAREGLSDEARALEERRKRALDDLRDISSTLQDLLAGSGDANGRDEASVSSLSLRRRR